MAKRLKSRRKHYQRLYFTVLFIFFGLLIACCTLFVNYRLELIAIETRVDQQAQTVFNRKTDELRNYMFGLEDIVIALRESNTLKEYVAHPTEDNYTLASSLFYAFAKSRPSLMQVRYIASSGKEMIRVDYHFGDERPTLIKKHNLQDKSHRYYFIEASSVEEGDFWYSHLDLNKENKEIEVPHKPVLRIASPVFVDSHFEGIVIINVHTKHFLQRLLNHSFFTLNLVDKGGFYIWDSAEEKSWSRYLVSGHTIYQDYPINGHSILTSTRDLELEKIDKIYAGRLTSFFQKDKAILILTPKEKALASLAKEQRKAAFLIVFFIVFLSVPLAYFISKLPAGLHKKIADQNEKLKEHVDLIDQNIHTATIGINKNIQEVSTAFSKNVGKEKDELINHSYEQFYCSETPREHYEEIWKTIQSGKSWSGEIQHKISSDTCFWADTIIYPKYDEDGKIIGGSAIYQDISDKKRIEHLSVTDVMTGLYNRRFFNTIIEKEYNRAKREESIIYFGMLDVDFFKQYNDNYGHQKGDTVLKDISLVMRSKMARGSDYCFRLGGEEFGIVYSRMEQEKAFELMESIRVAILQLGISHNWSDIADVITISIGLLVVTPGPGIDVDKIYKHGDKALYEAKRGGRNQTVLKTLNPTVT